MKLSSFIFILLSVFIYSEIKSQNWNQIGITSPSDFDPLNYGSNNPFAHIGIVYDLKFEPEYNGQTQTRLFATGVSSGLYLSESGNGNDWNLLNTDFLPETGIGDFVINPTWGKRYELIIGTGLYKLKMSRSYDAQFFKGQGFFKTDLRNNPIVWNQIDQTFISGPVQLSSAQFWNESGCKKFVSKILQKDDSTLIAVIIEDRSSTGITSINSCVYKSIDGGVNWEKKFTMSDFAANDIDIDPYNGLHIFITANFTKTTTNPNLFQSTDFGSNWNPVTTVFPAILQTSTYYKASFSHTKPNIIFVSRFEPPVNHISVNTIFKIDLLSPTIASFYASASFFENPGKASAFEMSNDDFFVTGSSNVATFVNFSVNPTPSYFDWGIENVHTDIRAFAYYPMTNDFVAATDGGINKFHYNPNVSKSYSISNISSRLTIDRILKISSYQKNTGIFGYTHWDNGPVFRKSNWLSNKFVPLLGNENNIFAIGQNQIVTASLNGEQVIRYNIDFNIITYDPLWIYSKYSSSLISYDGIPRILTANHLTLNDNYKKIIVVGQIDSIRMSSDPLPPITTGIFILPYYDATNQTTKDATSICQKVLDAPASGKAYIQPRMSINNDNYVYTGYEYGINGITIFKSVNGGFNWQQINSNLAFGGRIIDIAVDPLNPDQICLASENKLLFWNTLTQDIFIMPEIPNINPNNDKININTITYVNSSTILAATDFGLYIFYRDKNGTLEWKNFNLLLATNSQKLPNLRIADVEYLFKDNIVRAATMGRGAFENTMPVNCIKSLITTTIDQDVTLLFPLSSNSDIIISNNSTLTIKAELKMAPGTKITIEKGSTLTIDLGGVILNLCDNTTWNGIIAYGDHTKPQTVAFQARVNLQNGTIKNALTAIHSDGGAIITASNSTFENCRHSISLVDYPSLQSMSIINECTFICNRPIYGYQNESQSDFISMWNIRGVRIMGNHFENSIPFGGTFNGYRGKGIFTIDASYTLTPSYSLIYGNQNCFMPAGIKNTFKQLSIGLDLANGSGINDKVDAFENIFENCGEAINITNSVGSRLFLNSILMNDIYSGKANHLAFKGISFDNSTDFIAEQNTFNIGNVGINSNYFYEGISVNNSDITPVLIPAKSSYIYHNFVSFSGSLPGFTSRGLIVNNSNNHLYLLCNHFTNLSKGMVLSGNLNNQCTIGISVFGADNEFPGIPNPNDEINGDGLSNPITYFNFSQTFSGSNNVIPDNNLAIGTKCDNNSYGTTTDYYCTLGKGKLEPGGPIGGGGGNGGGDIALSITVVPNPANNIISLTLFNFSDNPLDVSISNTQGIDLIYRHFNSLSELIPIDIQSLPDGFYDIQVFNSIGEFATCHFIVLRQ